MFTCSCFPLKIVERRIAFLWYSYRVAAPYILHIRLHMFIISLKRKWISRQSIQRQKILHAPKNFTRVTNLFFILEFSIISRNRMQESPRSVIISWTHNDSVFSVSSNTIFEIIMKKSCDPGLFYDEEVKRWTQKKICDHSPTAMMNKLAIKICFPLYKI